MMLIALKVLFVAFVVLFTAHLTHLSIKEYRAGIIDHGDKVAWSVFSIVVATLFLIFGVPLYLALVWLLIIVYEGVPLVLWIVQERL